jgi:tetratricopeptide (TPR) repeat protein
MGSAARPRAPLIFLGTILLILATACQTGGARPDDTSQQGATQESQTLPTSSQPVERAPDVAQVETSAPASAVESGAVAPHVNARIQAAVERAQRGDIDGANQSLMALVNESEGGFLAAYNLGVIADRRGQYDIAVRRYAQALQKYPDFTPALTNLVRIYLRQDRPQDADALVRRYVDLRPENLDHRAVRLEVMLFQGRYEDVVCGARDLLRQDERHVGAMIAMAHANIHLERYELARAILASALALSPNRPELYYLSGLVERKMGNDPSAMANFRKAVDLQPNYPEARNNLAVIYHERRDYDGAIEQLQAAVADYPEFKEAYLNLGNAYKGAARFREAEQAFMKALAIDVDYADAHFNLGILYLESPVPGIEEIPRYQRAIEAFNRYRHAARGRLASDDPVERYIAEANKAIEQTRQREEMMRRAQIQSEKPAVEEADEDEDAP